MESYSQIRRCGPAGTPNNKSWVRIRVHHVKRSQTRGYLPNDSVYIKSWERPDRRNQKQIGGGRRGGGGGAGAEGGAGRNNEPQQGFQTQMPTGTRQAGDPRISNPPGTVGFGGDRGELGGRAVSGGDSSSSAPAATGRRQCGPSVVRSSDSSMNPDILVFLP